MSTKELFNLIPEKKFDFLIKKYNTDYKVKKLPGKTVFKLLLHSLFSENSYTLRKISENFNDNNFQRGILEKDNLLTINYSALHYRLQNIDPNFFIELFNDTVKVLKPIIQNEKTKYNILRFDSTIISLSAKLLNIGFKAVGKNSKSNNIKLTMSYSDYPQQVNLYTEKKYKGENTALGESILSEEIPPRDIIIFDRGLTNRNVFDKITSNGNLFVSRMNTNYKLKVVSEEVSESLERPLKKVDEVRFIKERKGYLYTRDNKPTENIYRILHFERTVPVSKDSKRKNVATRRSLRTKYKDKNIEDIICELEKEELIFVTNIGSNELKSEEIARIYKSRWEIETFFKFVKQELHLGHLLNRSKNGILSVVYIILIFSLLVLAYRKQNKLKGYKYVKYKMMLDIQNEIYELVIKRSGGSVEKWTKSRSEEFM